MILSDMELATSNSSLPHFTVIQCISVAMLPFHSFKKFNCICTLILITDFTSFISNPIINTFCDYEEIRYIGTRFVLSQNHSSNALILHRPVSLADIMKHTQGCTLTSKTGATPPSSAIIKPRGNPRARANATLDMICTVPCLIKYYTIKNIHCSVINCFTVVCFSTFIDLHCTIVPTPVKFLFTTLYFVRMIILTDKFTYSTSKRGNVAIRK